MVYRSVMGDVGQVPEFHRAKRLKMSDGEDDFICDDEEYDLVCKVF